MTPDRIVQIVTPQKAIVLEDCIKDSKIQENRPVVYRKDGRK
jgi:hypothetical protein